MSDVFISYARADRAIAQALADDLRNLGYRVWWDAELVGSDDFYEIILKALKDAKAAIVIWTEASVRSRFVRDEARYALHLDKLVSAKLVELDVFAVPFGFQGQHIEDVQNRPQLVRALDKLGCQRSATEPVTTKISSAEDIVAALGRELPAAEKQEAIRQFKELAPADDAVTEGSWLQSLLQGMLLRVPRFQLTTSATWSSIGMALSLLLLVLGLGYFIEEGPIKYWLNDQPVLLATLFSTCIALMFILAWLGFHRFARARLLAASWISAIAAAYTTLGLAGAVPMFVWNAATNSFGGAGFIVTGWSGFALALLYAGLRIRSYR